MYVKWVKNSVSSNYEQCLATAKYSATPPVSGVARQDDTTSEEEEGKKTTKRRTTTTEGEVTIQGFGSVEVTIEMPARDEERILNEIIAQNGLRYYGLLISDLLAGNFLETVNLARKHRT
jgi:hypothetical protein